jgi:hypothetical protein
MTLEGKIHNGVVVFEGGAALPEGTPVIVVVDQPQTDPNPAKSNLMSEEEQRRVCEIIDRIAALPIEGSTEPFSGADRDKILYGKPY